MDNNSFDEVYDKQYYKIKDVAEIIGVPQSTIRFWEKEFPELRPMRSMHNIRYYKPSDIRKLKIIYYLIKEKGLKIDAAKEQLRLNPSNVSRQTEIIERLKSVRESLLNLLNALNIRK